MEKMENSIVVVKLPARHSKAFKALPLVAQELLHTAHRIQFALRTPQARKLSEDRLQAMRAGLLRCLEVAEMVQGKRCIGR